MTHELRLFFTALQFLTRLPVPRWVGFEPAWLNASARYFPAVGCVVGGLAALVLWVAGTIFTPAVAVGLSMAATLIVTGGFHEDGFADTCDGLGGAVSRERALEIMKDSRIGAYGAIGLVIMLGLKAATLVSLLVSMNPSTVFAASVFAHSASRAAAVSLIRCLPYAGDLAHAKAKPLAQRISGGGLAVAIASVLLVAIVLAVLLPTAWPALAVSLVAVVVVTAACKRWLRRRLGGYTGDTLGATQQIAELGVLLAWLAVQQWR